MNGMKFNRQRSLIRFEQVLDLIEDRLDQIGEIRLAEVWKLCENHNLTYGLVAAYFEKIMELMIEQKKAVKLTRGSYCILKPNRRQAPPDVDDEPAKPLTEILASIKRTLSNSETLDELIKEE